MAEIDSRGRESPASRPLMASKKSPGGSHLRAEAPTFRPEELPRPANLRNLKTRRPNARLEALDLVPFTPSQGVLTPSPNNFAATNHEQQVYAVYSATPQVATSVAYAEQSSMQSSSDESSGNSFASTISPFHWPMPVSPTAFPVRQGQYLMSTLMDPGRPHYSSMMAGGSQDFLYPFPLQPGSPVYVSPGSPLVGAAWNQPFNRQRSRISGPVAGPIFVVQSPGSPMYPGMNPGDYPRGVAMTVFPVPGVHPGSPTFAASAGAGPSSPLWGGAVHMGPLAVQPSTPPRSTQITGSGKNGAPFRGTHLSVTPEVPERAGSSSLSDSTPERSPGIPTMPGTFARTTPEQPMPRMNARQRRTLRRAQEREAKQRAEQEAKQRAELEAVVAIADSGTAGEERETQTTS